MAAIRFEVAAHSRPSYGGAMCPARGLISNIMFSCAICPRPLRIARFSKPRSSTSLKIRDLTAWTTPKTTNFRTAARRAGYGGPGGAAARQAARLASSPHAAVEALVCRGATTDLRPQPPAPVNAPATTCSRSSSPTPTSTAVHLEKETLDTISPTVATAFRSAFVPLCLTWRIGIRGQPGITLRD